MSNSRVYEVWKNMRGRCNGWQKKQYDDYAGRGITICKRWSSFRAFLDDMGEPPEGMTLDRIDNDGNYSRDNCRWATHSQQILNRRILKSNTSGVTGVCFYAPRNHWIATFRSKRLGAYVSKERAIKARKQAEANHEAIS